MVSDGAVHGALAPSLQAPGRGALCTGESMIEQTSILGS